MKIKAISLWQPWASLIAVGAKQYETRSWATSYYGPIAIHAAKRFDEEQDDYCHEPPFYDVLKPYHTPDGFVRVPLGCVVAVARLAYCISTDLCGNEISEMERAFGDYSSKRFAWKLVDVCRLPVPIPCAGKQGLWEWTVPDELVKWANTSVAAGIEGRR